MDDYRKLNIKPYGYFRKSGWVMRTTPDRQPHSITIISGHYGHPTTVLMEQTAEYGINFTFSFEV